MKFIEARTIPDAWFRVNKKILKEGKDYKVERGSEETQTKKIAVSLKISNPEERPLVDERAPVSNVNKYALEHLFSPDKQDYEYTYGYRLRDGYDQIQKVIDKFKEEKHDRQNIVTTRVPEDLENENPPCLTIIDFEIIEDKLYNYSYWRSWDAHAGLPSNLAGIQLLSEHIAKEIGVETGEMCAFSKNLHLYKRQFSFVEDLITDSSEDRDKYSAGFDEEDSEDLQ